MRIALILIFLCLAAVSQAQEFNPKAIDTITLQISQSGELDINGSVQNANLSLYIPQEGVQDVKISSNQNETWDYATDSFGNKIVNIQWQNPKGIVTYKLGIIVKSSAKFVNPKIGIGSDPSFLAQTNSIVFTDGIKQASYPYERTWQNVARLAEFVYNYVDYDISLVGKRHSSDWVFQNRRGVCVEHANLFAAMLRSSGIPARYVVGYAYSSFDKKLIGHTWIEVLAGDGTWVPFDPTWLEGGYLDATHIKTANLLDDNQTDTLRYFGTGKIKWKRGDSSTSDLYIDEVEILDYTTRNLTSIDVYAPDASLGGYGYVKASINSENCMINQLSVSGCIDSQKNPVLAFYDKDRTFYSCGTTDVYWFYREMDGKSSYECPVTVFDQIGSSQHVNIKSIAEKQPSIAALSGPDTVSAGEAFKLTASAPDNFIFYSPELGRNPSETWDLALQRQGTYSFYLFSGSSLILKNVTVVGQKNFDLFVAAPSRVKRNQTFQINVTSKNLGSKRTDARMRIEFDSSASEQAISFQGNEEKISNILISSTHTGQQQLSVSLLDDSLATFSTQIYVEDSQQSNSFFDGIIGGLSGLFSAIANALSGIFHSVVK